MATVKEDRLTETVNAANIIYRHVYFINVTAIILVRLTFCKRVLLLQTTTATTTTTKKNTSY